MSGNTISALSVPTFIVLFWITAPALHAAETASPAAHFDWLGDTLPESVSPASIAERQALWDTLRPEEQDQHVQRFVELVGPAVRQKIEEQTAKRAPDVQPVAALQGSGVATAGIAPRVLEHHVTADSSVGEAAVLQPPSCDPVERCLEARQKDADGDGLIDRLELQLAQGLVPGYHVSGGEQQATGFVTLQNTPALAAQAFLGQVPAAVHYRVTPLFEAVFRGIPQKFLQIDYLTIWNRDDGLQVGGLCRTNAAILGGLIGLGLASVLDGAQSHAWDVERSAVLVAAPTVDAGRADAFRAHDYYVAAHEGTFLDHSAYIPPRFPWPIGHHAALWLSQSKHATYPFNPDYQPLIPWPVITFTYNFLANLYLYGWIGDFEYIIYRSIADSVYFGCIIEHFNEQGAALPTFQSHVGEQSQPINGSSWIADPRVRSKFEPLWILQ